MKMILRSSVVIAALFGFYFWGLNSKPPVNDKESLVLQGLMQAIEYAHMTPKKVDDELSKTVFKTYMDRIDGAKRYLNQKDIDKLKKHELLLDDQINSLTFEFFNESLPMLDAGMEKAQKHFTEAIDGKISFDKGADYETDPDKMKYAANDGELKERWKNIVQWEVTTRWVEKIEDQKEKEVKEGLKTEEELKTEVIKEVKKRYVDFFDRVKKLRRSDRMETYLGSIANYFDPHTDYFSPKEKQDFDINMGGKLEGIGARLQTDGDYTKIFSVVVGGPAWKTKKIEDNDIIMKVAQKGQEAVDITGMRVDDVVQLVRGKKGTTVVLTVKKKDNSIIEVSIERDEVQLEDGKAKAVLINIPNKVQNIGYIHLPKFYSSFESDGGNSCATDVANEIKKLKAQNVNGIILDLRNNSGGSLHDVVEMSGYFIESGPIVQVKGREEKPMLHQDKDKGVLYDGPLVIMVNQYSASASEIIAAAMQDYNRAIIVGSNSTFGKGTVQRFYDLDRISNGYEQFKPLGNVKITMQKFYRVNGGSTQLKGVVPDVILPDIYHFIETGEKEYDNPLTWTEIEATKYGQSVVLLENKNKIIANSGKRLAQNNDFNLILDRAQKLKTERDESKFPLKLNSYRAMIDKRKEDGKKYENIMKNDIPGLEISNLSADIEKINIDESNKAKNDEFIKDLKKDIYLEETMYIIRDMISLEKSFVALQDKIGDQ